MADVLACVKRNLSPAGAALLVYPASRERELAATAQNTLLDIISALAVTGHKEHTIYRFSHKGKPQ
jgi:tRNA1(Val) A37 N6-methylase TrmN6